MKKLISALVASMLILGTLVGCSARNDEKALTFIISQRDEFLSSLDNGAKNQAKKMDYKLVTQDALSDASKQLQFVTASVAKGAKAVIVNLVDANIAEDIVETARDTKVVFINRLPTDESVFNDSTVYVGSDEQVSGKLQGEFLANYFKEKGKTDIKYIMLNGITGQLSTVNRTESVLRELKDQGITATAASAPLVADYDRAEAMTQITPLLNSGIEFDCIISNNDSMALGAIEAMEHAGMDPSSIPIVGIDGTKDALEAIKSGKMAMSVYQDPINQGAGAVVASVNLIEGKPVASDLPPGLYVDDENPNIIWVPWAEITKENVQEFENK